MFKIVFFYFFATIFIFSATLSTQSASAAQFEMNILTMNVHCQNNNWQWRLQQILKEIIQVSYDVVSFQEVCEEISQNNSQLEFIKSYLTQNGYPLQTFEALDTHKAWDRYNEHLLVFSKHQTQAVDKGVLPISPLQRGYIAVQINQAWYVNTHLEYKSENASYRIQQIQFLMQRFQNQAHLIMGDFNSVPNSFEQALFAQNHYQSFFPGISVIGNDPNYIIDGFWLSPELKKIRKIKQGSLRFTEKIANQYLSDHFAVWLQLTQ